MFGKPVGGMKGRYGIAVNNALEAGITPEQIKPAKDRYLEHPRWQGAACNPQALVNNWNTFGPDAHLLSVPVELRDAYRGV